MQEIGRSKRNVSALPPPHNRSVFLVPRLAFGVLSAEGVNGIWNKA